MAAFGIQSVVSGAAGHLLDLKCAMQQASAADVFYGWLAVYSLIPAVLLGSYSLYRWRKGDNETKVMAAVVFLLYFFYPQMCSQLFAAVSCRSVEGKLYLTVDLEEQCWHGRHLYWMIGCGVPTAVFGVVGLPCLALRTLQRLKQRRRMSVEREEQERLADECRLQLGILYDGYRPELYWWEVTAVARKVFIAMLAELMEGALQTQCSMLLLLLFVIATVQFRPYASRVLQALEVGSLMVCLLCLWAGGVFFQYPGCATTYGDMEGWMWCKVSGGLVGFILVAFLAMGSGCCIFLTTEKKHATMGKWCTNWCRRACGKKMLQGTESAEVEMGSRDGYQQSGASHAVTVTNPVHPIAMSGRMGQQMALSQQSSQI